MNRVVRLKRDASGNLPLSGTVSPRRRKFVLMQFHSFMFSMCFVRWYHDNFLSIRDNFLSTRDNFLSTRDNFPSIHDNFLPIYDNFLSTDDNFLSIHDNLLCAMTTFHP